MVLELGERIILYIILGGVVGILYTLRKIYSLERMIANLEMQLVKRKSHSSKKKRRR